VLALISLKRLLQHHTPNPLIYLGYLLLGETFLPMQSFGNLPMYQLVILHLQITRLETVTLLLLMIQKLQQLALMLL
jgi:hypothetical protein